MSIPKTPQGLQKAGRLFWKKVLGEFELEETHDLERLGMACKCLDDLAQTEERVKTDGMFTENRYGTTVEHPGLKVIRDMRQLFIRIIREIGLDIESPKDNRPPRRY